MKLHRNAKTTPAMRALIVHRIRQEQRPAAEVAAAAGVSVRTDLQVAAEAPPRWAAGARGRVVTAASAAAAHRRPRRSRRSSPLATNDAPPGRSPRGFKCRARPSRPCLVRVGLNRLARLVPPPPVQRYERTRPGELVHLDIKPLGRILRVGHRIHPHQRSSVGAGWEYVHVAVDDYSRAAYVEVLPDQTGATTAAFLRRTIGWFARRGITVSRVLTDNGSGYISRRFRAAADARAACDSRARVPIGPRPTAKRNDSFRRSFAAGPTPCRIPARGAASRALRPWLRHYNVERPHAALGYQPPCVRFPRVAQ